MVHRSFTPAAGRFAPIRLYDPVIALTRERLWRSVVAMYVAPRAGDVVADIGCGTGSLAVLLGRAAPRARIIGVDPDPTVLDIARSKAAAAGITVDWRDGMGDELADSLGLACIDTIVSSLVLHQCSLEMKTATLASMREALRHDGRVVVADFGEQRSVLMRLLFCVVQLADGREHTRTNADGVLPDLMVAAGFREVREAETVATASGSISIYVGLK
jgi:ubiquinone/menaquinone biosynthesis C-methylase UbiE